MEEKKNPQPIRQESQIVEKLFNSFSELELAIESAKYTLQKKGTIPKEVLERLDSYDSILAKQRTLATALCDYIHQKNWDEVNRLVGLINGLSAMIRDDAKSILSSLCLNSDLEPLDTEKYLC